MQAYISISYSKRSLLGAELQCIIETLEKVNIKPFVFVDSYKSVGEEDKKMMDTAFAYIDRSDLLIAETSDKAIGIGVEVGYARAKGKPVIYVRRFAAEHSTTIAGASDFQVIYKNETDLEDQLARILDILVRKKEADLRTALARGYLSGKKSFPRGNNDN